MSAVASIIERLKPDTDAMFAIVEGAGGWAALNGKLPTARPAAYVVTLKEAGGDNERMTGPVMQKLESDIAVIIVTDNVSDPIGGAASDDIEVLKQWVRARLLGFTPAGADEPLIFVSGELLQTRNGSVWWEDVFGNAAYIEEQF
ncbi:hypothetical protein [Mesorhizobium sp. J428]|uniref:phage tail terminator protein n=1 Tax=Mesorhizobium sp. J428 TaxID=2898440 RepID=UPI002150D472|nr:hypothetical protein [Mesorhizobium sp. J428]MCR5855994.1 hypothetical protein [Mesorhizobium sp. J428]